MKISKARSFFTLAILVTFAIGWKTLFIHSKPDLTVVGYVDLTQGLGRQSAELMEAFSSEMKVNLIPTGKKKQKKARRLSEKKAWGKVIIFEDMLWAPRFEKYRAILDADPQSIKIAYSMWESTKIPDEWVMILNEHFDAVVVPSPFLVGTYVNSGVKVPVFYLPLGLNLDAFLSQPLKKQASQPFVFGNLSVCSERKNQRALIHAFAKAFGNDPNVQLRLNCRLGEKEVSKGITKAIVDLGLNNVILTQFNMTKEQYIETFKGIDCYVSPSKGEGFSIQPREAMALGIPVISTNSTGQIPICESGLVKVVNAPIKEAAIFPWGSCYGHHFNCDVDELATALIEVKEQYQCYLEKAETLREWAGQYQYANLKGLYRALIKPKQVMLGSENQIQPDCLITNSQQLHQKYQNLFMATPLQKN